MNLRSRILDSVFWLGWNALWVMPEPLARASFDAAGWLAARLRSRGMRQLELNLARALGLPQQHPRVRTQATRAMRAYMRYYCETFLLPRWSTQRVRDSVRAVNSGPVLAALREGGVILTLPHSGNWDLAGAWAADQLGSLCTVAERLRPEGVFRKFLGMRRAIGITLMPLSGEPGVYEFLRDCVATGRVVALLGDRDVAGSGLGTPFFGHRAPMPIGASLLAVDTNRPLFTVSTYFDDRCLVIEFGDQVPVTGHGSIGRERLRAAAAATAEIAARFEKTIAERPDNWYQLQPVWPDLVAQ